MRKTNPGVSLVMVWAGLLTGFEPGVSPLWAQDSSPQDTSTSTSSADTNASLKIVVLEGEDGVNIIKKKTAVKPVVEVRDRNDSPVAGIAVKFLLPQSGPGGTFAHGAKTLTVMTDSAGRATVTSFKPAGAGSFHIEVTASTPGQPPATATIGQTNYLTVAAAQAAGAGGAAGAATGGISTGLAVGIAAAVGAAAVGAIVAAKTIGGGGGKKTGISIGTPRIP